MLPSNAVVSSGDSHYRLISDLLIANLLDRDMAIFSDLHGSFEFCPNTHILIVGYPLRR